MTRDEFRTWMSKYFAAFPSVREWLSNVGNEDAQKSITNNWFIPMMGIEFEEAEFVLQMMIAGDVPAVGSYDSDREQTCIRIKEQVHADRARRNSRTTSSVDPGEYVRPPKVNQSLQCGVALAGLLKDLAAGVPKDEAAAKWLPPSGPDERQPRYRCLTCKDTGLVKVWHPKAMAAAEGGTLTRRSGYTAAVRCSCHAGNRQCLVHLPEFHAAKWCAVGPGSFDEEAAKLTEYMQTYRENCVKSRPNYEESFA